MSFNPYDNTPYKETAEKQTPREIQLIKAVFTTPQGRELLEIFKHRLIHAGVFDSAIPEPVGRQIAGAHSVYRKFIKIAEEKPKEGETK